MKNQEPTSLDLVLADLQGITADMTATRRVADVLQENLVRRVGHESDELRVVSCALDSMDSRMRQIVERLDRAIRDLDRSKESDL